VHSEDEQKGMNPTRAIARRGRGVKKHRPTGRFCRGGGGGAWRPETASGVQFLPVHMTPAVVLRTDVLRKELFKVKEWDRLPESAYRPEITAQVYETTAKRAERILSQGRPNFGGSHGSPDLAASHFVHSGHHDPSTSGVVSCHSLRPMHESKSLTSQQ
jgi:hypothetical protein